jgi:capsid portal protein
MHSPNGKEDGIQIIQLSEVAAKDELLNIKNVSRDDMMAVHRVPPKMMGIIPAIPVNSVMWRKPAAYLFTTN